MAHLLELRSRLVKCALALALTTGFSLLFVEQEVDILVQLAYPHTLQALKPTETFVAYVQVAFYTGHRSRHAHSGVPAIPLPGPRPHQDGAPLDI